MPSLEPPPGATAEGAVARREAISGIHESLGDAVAAQVFSALTAGVVPATATGIAEFMGLDRDVVTHRLALLQQRDLVEPITTASGGKEASYRATRDALITDEEWALLPPGDRRRYMTAALEVIHERTWSAVARGGFDAHDVHLSWVPAILDQQGYEDVTRATLEMLERVRDIHAEVVQRRADDAAVGESVKTDLMLLHFQRGGDADAAATDPAELARIYELSEDIADGLALEAPDWRELGAAVRELARLVQRSAAPSES